MTHACLEKLMRAKLSGYEEVCSLTSDHAGNVVRATIDVLLYFHGTDKIWAICQRFNGGLETLESSSEGYYITWALLKSNYGGKAKSEVYGIGITRKMDDNFRMLCHNYTTLDCH